MKGTYYIREGFLIPSCFLGSSDNQTVEDMHPKLEAIIPDGSPKKEKVIGARE
jgi:hypothetical protein